MRLELEPLELLEQLLPEADLRRATQVHRFVPRDDAVSSAAGRHMR